jgi:hypothetical protein
VLRDRSRRIKINSGAPISRLARRDTCGGAHLNRYTNLARPRNRHHDTALSPGGPCSVVARSYDQRLGRCAVTTERW